MSMDITGFRSPLTDLKKAAIVLVAVGPVVSAQILRNIPEKEADKVARAIAELDLLTPEEVQETMVEYDRLLVSDRLLIKGGLEYADKMLTEAYGSTVAQQLLGRLMRSMGSESATFENFSKTDPLQLARLVQDEHPQTIALVLSHLKPGQAAALLRGLPIEIRSSVTSRMAGLDQISPEVVRNIASVLDQKLQNVGQLSREAYGGVRAVAEIFNRLEAGVCAQLMNAVEQANKPLFDNIREFMFVFRDLERLDATAIAALTQRSERGVLMIALKGTTDSLREKFLATQSQRGAAMMRDDLESLGPLKRKDVDAAQQTIIALARQLEKEGTISLSAGADEQYV